MINQPSQSSLFFTLLLGAALWGVGKAQIILQAEDGEGFPAQSVRWRSQAEGLQTAWLISNRPPYSDRLSFNVCVGQEDNVTVNSVRFSRDGDVQEAFVLVDGAEVGSFNTTGASDFGNEWNIFNLSNATFQTVTLSPGQPHVIEVALRNSTDPWGIEIDQISLSFASSATADDISCLNSMTTASTTDGVATTSSVADEAAKTPEGNPDVPGDVPGDNSEKDAFIDPCGDDAC